MMFPPHPFPINYVRGCAVTYILHYSIIIIITVYCLDPPIVQHATHNGETDSNHYQLETVLKYSCYPGYLTVGFAHAKCFLYNTTAQWFGPDVTCKGNSS